jgi:hypothetical protein
VLLLLLPPLITAAAASTITGGGQHVPLHQLFALCIVYIFQLDSALACAPMI